MKKILIGLLFISSLAIGQGVQYGPGQGLVTGSITTQNLNPLTGVPTAGSFVRLDLNNQSTVAIDVSGTYTGALSVQYSTDGGSTWVTITSTLALTLQTTSAKSATIASASVGKWTMNVSGWESVRVSGLAAMTGTAAVRMKAVSGAELIGFDEALPTGANVIGAVTQSGTWTAQIGNTANTTPILANGLIPVGTTTGDTGAKVATGNGATLTNVNAKGVQCIINMGAVSGTTPTAVIKLQGSSDAGTTWIDIPGATTASLTATGVYGITVYPGVAAVAGTTTTGTTAMVSAIIPRTWRLVWTIAGTTPSFTITNVQIAYIF